MDFWKWDGIWQEENKKAKAWAHRKCLVFTLPRKSLERPKTY